ncbi:hypothetical protein BD779DRAFT_1475263 [Infundibulicybe gibba]|nr:hypothetical protein BD779DRAFT_1475263 [Infundibulicybe gibba]
MEPPQNTQPAATVTDPPVTPARASVTQTAKLKATPNSYGTAPMSEYAEWLEVDDVGLALLEDIKDHKKRDVRAVVEAFLLSCLPESEREEKRGIILDECLAAVLPICNGKSPNGSNFRFHLDDYATSTAPETDRYKPFVLAFNHALEDLKNIKCGNLRSPSKLDIMFHQNDPMPLKGTHNGAESSRKPDTVLVSLDTARAAAFDKDDPNWRDPSWRELAYDTAGKQPKNNFSWGNILSSHEFRFPTKKRSTCGVLRSGRPREIDPQPLPTLKMLQEAEANLAQEAGAPELQASAKDSAPKSRKPKRPAPKSREAEARPLRRSARHAPSGSNPSSLSMQEQPLASSSLRTKSSSSKRKAESELPTSNKKFRDTPKLPKRLPPMLQSASDATERMSYGFWVTHVINLVIINNVAYVWYYDNENSVQSCGIDFIDDLPYFLVLLLAFQRFDEQNWGVMEEFKTVEPGKESTQPSSDGDTFLHFNEPELQFKLSEKKIRGHYGLKGRCTQILEATSNSQDPRDPTDTLEGVDMVAKLYWPQESRTPEAQILAEAHRVGKGNARIEGHLPELIYTRDFDQYSTKHIRALLDLESDNSERILRLIIFRRLSPITDLIGAEFWKAFWECFCCHLDLWRGGVRHCDISVSNLMYDKISKRGILNDFDLALLRARRLPSGTERTGTMPFMALDLLEEPAWKGEVRREYRHDAESFAWVLLWICCTYKDGKELPTRPLQCFIQRDFKTTYEKKWAKARRLEGGDLIPTTSYRQEYYNVAAKLLWAYGMQHFAAGGPKPHPIMTLKQMRMEMIQNWWPRIWRLSRRSCDSGASNWRFWTPASVSIFEIFVSKLCIYQHSSSCGFE